MKTLYAFACAFYLSMGLQAQNVFLIEQFDYQAGLQIRDFGWFAHSAGTTNPLLVTEGGLSLSQSTYVGSGIGNAVAIDNTGSDENKPLNQTVTAGSVYVSFLMEVPAEVTTENAGFFLHLGEYSNISSPVFTSISSAFRARTFVAPGSTPDKFKVGLNFNAATVPTEPEGLSGDLNLNETYLVVLKYEIIEGPDNDLVSIYIFADGDDISNEPASPHIGPLGGTAADLQAVQLVALRQYNAGQNIIVDGIVAQDTWAMEEVVEPTFDCPLILANFGDACNADGAPGEVDASCECIALEIPVLLVEQFDYPAGAEIRDYGWFAHSAGSTNPLKVTDGGLSLSQTDYIGSGIGNAVAIDNTGSDENKPFGQYVSSGNVYVSFLVNVPEEVTSAGEGYFLHLGEYNNPSSPVFTSISSAFRARTFVVAGSGPDKYRLGLTFNSATVPSEASDLSGELDINETYLVVLKYEIVEGANNDLVSLYVFADGADISSEPASATVGPVGGTAGDLSQVQLVALRQYNAAQNIIVDGIVAQQTWEMQEVQGPAFDCPALSANFGDACNANGAPGEVSADCECIALPILTFLEEQFDYPADTLIRDFGWISHSKPTVNPIRTTTGGLSWSQTSYQGSGIGNAASVSNTGSNENRPFSQSVNSGNVYLSFLMQVPDEVTSENAGFFLHLGEYASVSEPQFDTIASAFRARTFKAPGSTPDKFRLGLTFNAAAVPTSASALTAELNINETYLVVIKYQVVPGSNNDLVSLYVFADGDDISTEPALAAIGPVGGSARDLEAVQLVALRQFNAAQNVIVDGIIAKNGWAIEGGAIEFDCPSLAANIGDPCDANGASGLVNENCDCVEIAACTANGGTLEAPANRSFCVGTGSPSGINVTAVGASGSNQRWALIDNAGNVLETRGNNSQFNLDSRAPGNYTIRYIRFENDVTNIGSITNISQVSSLVGCYGLASNAITVFLRDEPTAGTLTALTPTTFCANSGSVSSIQLAISGNQGENGRFGLTSAALSNQIVASNTSGSFNLNGFDPGTYNVRYISYQQGVSLASVQFASQLQGCYDLSNVISLTLQNCPSATLSSSPSPTTGVSFVSFSTPKEAYATLEVYDMSGRMVQRIFNQVTTSGQEYRIEFDGSALPNGVYLYRLTTESEVVVEKFMIAR